MTGPLVGQPPFVYQADDQWERRPDGYTWSEATSLAIDADDNVWVFHRGDRPMMAFRRDGSYLTSWGEGQFNQPHGVAIGPDGSLLCTDYYDHTVRRFSTNGDLLQTYGVSGRPSDTGATSVDYRTIQRAAGPFCYPTNVAFAPDGESMYVADGYGNARVHQFTLNGKFIRSWGEPGVGPGQFHVVHGVSVSPDGRIWICDRENSRIQIFSPTGEWLSEWRNIARPCRLVFDRDGHIYVAELGYRAGMWPGTYAPSEDATGGRVSIFDATGNLLSRWGGGDRPTEPGDFFAPHDIAVDSHGDVYVAEVAMSAGGKRGMVPATCHTLQKFARLTRSRVVL